MISKIVLNQIHIVNKMLKFNTLTNPLILLLMISFLFKIQMNKINKKNQTAADKG